MSKDLFEHARTLARAVEHAVREHGAPNTFSFGELHDAHGGPSPLIAGRCARDMINCEMVEGALRVTVTEDRRISVEPKTNAG
jgi:hypothetical protein